MHAHTITALLLVVSVIHLLPAVGVMGGERLAALYGITFDEPNTALLMQHRAVLFGLMGAFIGAAAFRPAWQVPAVVAGFVSVMSFLVLAWASPSINTALMRVVKVDLVALLALVIAVPLLWAERHGQ